MHRILIPARLVPSFRPFAIHPSVRPSVRPSIRLSELVLLQRSSNYLFAALRRVPVVQSSVQRFIDRSPFVVNLPTVISSRQRCELLFIFCCRRRRQLLSRSHPFRLYGDRSASSQLQVIVLLPDKLVLIYFIATCALTVPIASWLRRTRMPTDSVCHLFYSVRRRRC